MLYQNSKTIWPLLKRLISFSLCDIDLYFQRQTRLSMFWSGQCNLVHLLNFTYQHLPKRRCNYFLLPDYLVVIVSVVCPHSYWIFFVWAESPLAPPTTTTTTTTATTTSAAAATTTTTTAAATTTTPTPTPTETTFPNNSTKKTHLGELPLFLSGKICFLHPSHSLKLWIFSTVTWAMMAPMQFHTFLRTRFWRPSHILWHNDWWVQSSVLHFFQYHSRKVIG